MGISKIDQTMFTNSSDSRLNIMFSIRFKFTWWFIRHMIFNASQRYQCLTQPVPRQTSISFKFQVINPQKWKLLIHAWSSMPHKETNHFIIKCYSPVSFKFGLCELWQRTWVKMNLCDKINWIVCFSSVWYVRLTEFW